VHGHLLLGQCSASSSPRGCKFQVCQILNHVFLDGDSTCVPVPVCAFCDLPLPTL
jgi:hypothetical protein